MHYFVRPGPAGSRLSDPIDTDMRKLDIKDKWSTMRDCERTVEEETKAMTAKEEAAKAKAAEEQEAKERVAADLIVRKLAWESFQRICAQGPEAMEEHFPELYRVRLVKTPADVAMEQMRDEFGSD
ncbi:hypothetical protein CDV36_002747 [Fusarium kuroshium]|uniref:Uncharacterized protein n=2 Tax=Fusarium solani species complex TaxID=232080 RepID=A0A3M2SJ26_9HYPO|nr:hypothetical protein CDV36_002747 [Fusarium kuroshium]RSL80593.1 hypothetical protein CEP51_006479 [Fusarium floridanum]